MQIAKEMAEAHLGKVVQIERTRSCLLRHKTKILLAPKAFTCKPS